MIMIRPTPPSDLPIRIIGGGAAGLSLAITLARSNIACEVIEASSYPRHKMCGEFLTGIDNATIDTLGIENLIAHSPHHHETAWFDKHGEIFRRPLPSTAYGISRHALDLALADIARELGCTIHENTRWKYSPDESLDGTIIATGRRMVRSSRWLGIKAHFTNLETLCDLEMHLADNAYVGLCKVDDGAVTVCGLFDRQHAGKTSGAAEQKLITTMRRCGLPTLAERVAAANFVDGSLNGISHVAFGIHHNYSESEQDKAIHYGDSFAVIPPFTGNGIAMALQGGVAAADIIVDYATGKKSWDEARLATNIRLHQLFNKRVAWANRLQPVLTSSLGKRTLRAISKTPLLPFNKLFHLTHG